MFDEKFKDIDIDNVTLQLSDYSLGYVAMWKNVSYSSFYHALDGSIRKVPYVTYFGFTGLGFTKCFGIERVNNNLLGIVSFFKQDIFPNGERPPMGKFIVSFHYPQQLHHSWSNMLYTWPKRKDNISYSMNFIIKSVEILKRRYKDKSPCMDDTTSFDEVVMDGHLKHIGCRAPYQKSKSNLPICCTKEKITQAMQVSLDTNRRPCIAMSNIQFSYEDTEEEKFGKGQFTFGVFSFQDQVKVIQQIEEIPFLILVGNAGGFVGIFLGM